MRPSLLSRRALPGRRATRPGHRPQEAQVLSRPPGDLQTAGLGQTPPPPPGQAAPASSSSLGKGVRLPARQVAPGTVHIQSHPARLSTHHHQPGWRGPSWLSEAPRGAVGPSPHPPGCTGWGHAVPTHPRSETGAALQASLAEVRAGLTRPVHREAMEREPKAIPAPTSHRPRPEPSQRSPLPLLLPLLLPLCLAHPPQAAWAQTCPDSSLGLRGATLGTPAKGRGPAWVWGGSPLWPLAGTAAPQPVVLSTRLAPGPRGEQARGGGAPGSPMLGSSPCVLGPDLLCELPRPWWLIPSDQTLTGLAVEQAWSEGHRCCIAPEGRGRTPGLRLVGEGHGNSCEPGVGARDVLPSWGRARSSGPVGRQVTLLARHLARPLGTSHPDDPQGAGAWPGGHLITGVIETAVDHF